MINYHQKLLKIEHKNQNNKRAVEILDELGNLYLKLNDKQQALESYQQKLILIKQIHDRKLEITTLRKIIEICESLLDNRLLLQYYQQLLIIKNQTGDRFEEALILGYMGVAYHRIGELHQALKHYERALSSIEKLKNVDQAQATLFSLRGKVYRDLKKPQQALKYYRQALYLRKKIGDRSGAIRINKHLNQLVKDISLSNII